MDLLEKLWLHGGGDKPVDRMWQLLPNSGEFEKRHDKIQDDLKDVCGADDFVTGELYALHRYSALSHNCC